MVSVVVSYYFFWPENQSLFSRGRHSIDTILQDYFIYYNTCWAKNRDMKAKIPI